MKIGLLFKNIYFAEYPSGLIGEVKMETPPFNPEPTRMMTRSVLAEIPTRLGRLSMTDPNGNATEKLFKHIKCKLLR